MVSELFLGTAWAQEAASGAAGAGGLALLVSYAPLILIFVIFYFLIIRPQGQAAKAHAALLAGLVRGQWVATDGGLVGEVQKVLEHSDTKANVPAYVRLALADGTEVVVQRVSIKRVLGEAEVALVAGKEAAKAVEKAAKGKK